MTGTTDADTTKPFQALDYTTIVSGGSLGSWTYGANAGQSKNICKGPVCAFVFETAGSYTTRTFVKDSASTQGTPVNNTITVYAATDPINGFTGTTYCISANTTPVAGSGGCPSSATGVQQSNWKTIVDTYVTTNNRILLKRGDTFTLSQPVSATANGPWSIEAYGTGAKPVISASSGVDNPMFGIYWPGNPTYGDGRVVDIYFQGNSAHSASVGLGWGRGSRNMLALRVDIYGTGAAGIDTSGGSDTLSEIPSRMVVMDSTITHIGYNSGTGHGIYGSGEQIAIVGNSISDTTGGGGTGMRVFAVDKWQIASNTINSTVNDNIKIHGENFATRSYYSQRFVVADNKLQGGASIILWIQQSNGGGDNERIRNFLVERNLFIAASNTSGVAELTATNGEIRNNLVDMSLAATGGGVFSAGPATVCCAVADDLRFYNNTVYTSASGAAGTVNAITLASGTTNMVARNNLVYVPNGTSPKVVNDGGAVSPSITYNTCGTGSVTSCGGGVTTNPFATTPTTTIISFRPSVAAYATSSGTNLFPSSARDALNCDQVGGSYHIGALAPQSLAQCYGVAGQ